MPTKSNYNEISYFETLSMLSDTFISHTLSTFRDMLRYIDTNESIDFPLNRPEICQFIDQLNKIRRIVFDSYVSE